MGGMYNSLCSVALGLSKSALGRAFRLQCELGLLE